MHSKNFLWLISTALLTCFIFGCNQKTKEARVVAQINDYVMTVEDIEDELKYSPYFGLKEQKLEEVLDLAVRKQVLIQEAQRQEIDKQKRFRKSIERYWRQTLIKELLKKETDKIYKTVDKEEQAEALNNWAEGLYKKAEIKIYEDVLRQIKEQPAF